MTSIAVITFICIILVSPFAIVLALLIFKPEVCQNPVIDLIKFSAVKPLRFPVMSTDETCSTGTEVFHTIFSLGEGACGKNVKSLDVYDTSTEMFITQYHTDGTKKDFIYKKTDIVGRVEIQYSKGGSK